jgi:signal peptidase I
VDSHAIVVRRLPDAPVIQAAEQPPKSLRWRVGRRLGRIGLNLAFAAIAGAAGLMLVPAALGFHRYIILTGSMTGTYDRGSIVYDLPVPVSQLKVGDPITYDPPAGYTSGVYKRVTHRIYWIGRGANGERAFRTKGDANRAPDVWKFMLGHGTQDRVVFHIPYLGYFFVLLGLKEFRMVLVGVPAVIMGLMMLRGLWRDAGVEAKRQKLAAAGWRQIDDPGREIVLVLPPVEFPAEVWRPARLELATVIVPRRSRQRPRASSATQPRRFQFGAHMRVLRLADRGPVPADVLERRAEAVAAALVPSDSAAACRLRVRALVLSA